MSILAGAYGGADAGRGLRRALDRSSPLSLLAILALSFAGAVMAGAGFVVSVAEAVPVGAFLLGLVLVGAAQTASAAALRLWWWRRRTARSSPEVALSPSGVPATAYLRSRASLITPVVTGTLLTVVAAGATSAAARGGTWWAVVLTALVTVYAGSTLAPFVAGRVAAGGVYLTPAGVEHRWALSVASVPWTVDTFQRSGSVLTAAAAPQRTLRWFVPLDQVDRDGHGTIAIPATFLGPTAEELLATLDLCRRDPALRRTLGTSAWLDLSRPPGISRR